MSWNTNRVRVSQSAGEPVPDNMWQDFAWAHQHRKTLLETYGEQVILVYHGQVIGVGAFIDEAVADAEQHLPDDDSIVTPIVEFLSYRSPLTGLRAEPTHHKA